MDEPRRTLAARREHSKGDGNFPDPEPTTSILERPADRVAEDVPKARDPRSAPKGNVTKGQEERNPDLETRDDYRPKLPEPRTGFESAHDAADQDVVPTAKPARPKARRSSSAKREVAPSPREGGARAQVRQAPKDVEKSARRAAVARRPQVGKRKTGTARRGDAVPRTARGVVSARKAAKASRSKPRKRRT
ncbi:MAG TPA: hypothetical protein VGQ86_05870 [Candidatus Limnocylindria bacterium]|nr:hypothetical protein [Candidatus Limnocylindria bacterium]